MDANAGVGKTLDRRNHCNRFIIVIPDRRVLRLLARSLFLAGALLLIPWLHGIQKLFDYGATSGAGVEPPREDLHRIVFRDMLNKHLLTVGEYAVFIGGSPDVTEIRALIDGGVVPPLDVVDESIDTGKSIPDGTVDFAFAANGFHSLPFINRVLRVGGVAALRFGTGTYIRSIQPNYKIVYLRRFHVPEMHTIVAIRKMSASSKNAGSVEPMINFCAISDAKRNAIRDLEDLLLEAPRGTFVESGEYLNRVKYLPQLTADNLKNYSGHVYVEVDHVRRTAGISEWFRQNYPTNGQDFDVYALHGDVAGNYTPVVTWTRKGKVDTGPIGLSDWLHHHVSKDDFVVMKMEVGGVDESLEVVEEMVRSKAVCLVDELFLVCDHEGRRGNGAKRKPYWQCVRLYGMLRKGGVAVHQWWG